MTNKPVIGKEELRLRGCVSCYFKSLDECEHNCKDDQVIPEGICQEYAEFLTSFAVDGSSAVMWENFAIFQAEQMAAADLKDYLSLMRDIKKAEKQKNFQLADELETKKNALKLWWIGINANIMKARGRQSTREAIHKEVIAPKLTIQQFNIEMSNAAKTVAEYEKKQITKK